MTRARLLILLAALAAIAGLALFADREDSPAVEAVGVQAPVTAPAPATATPANLTANTGASYSTATIRARPADPLALNFAATDDLLAFIEGIQAAAQDGDGVAAYYLYRALDRCQTEYAKRFGSGRRELPLDEVLTDESIVRQFGVEDLRRVHGQCERLRESDITRFGAADDWLMKGADAGYPRAQAELAAWYLQSDGPTPQTDSSGAARELARAALSSKDPEAFIPVSGVIEALNEEGPNVERRLSWYVAACMRGLDCGPRSESTRVLCRADPRCQPHESALDLIRREAGERFEAIERAAREINDAVDAGRLDELGLQESRRE